jgi:hypothetical protein
MTETLKILMETIERLAVLEGERHAAGMAMEGVEEIISRLEVARPGATETQAWDNLNSKLDRLAGELDEFVRRNH